MIASWQAIFTMEMMKALSKIFGMLENLSNKARESRVSSLCSLGRAERHRRPNNILPRELVQLPRTEVVAWTDWLRLHAIRLSSRSVRAPAKGATKAKQLQVEIFCLRIKPSTVLSGLRTAGQVQAAMQTGMAWPARRYQDTIAAHGKERLPRTCKQRS